MRWQRVRARLVPAGNGAISAISPEHGGLRRRLNRRCPIRTVSTRISGVLFADDQTTHHYAFVFRQRRKQETPIPTNDMWLAALVLQHDLALHARDRHFDHLPQIVRV